MYLSPEVHTVCAVEDIGWAISQATQHTLLRQVYLHGRDPRDDSSKSADGIYVCTHTYMLPYYHITHACFGPLEACVW